MLLPQIETADQVTDAQVIYLAGLAQTLSTQNDFAIQNYADSIMTSPDAQSALQSQAAVKLLSDKPPAGASFDIFNPTGNQAMMFTLSLAQENSFLPGLWQKIKDLFGSLRGKVKRIFCKVVGELGKDQSLDLKAIIKAVLLALIPALAATTGLMAVALPIVVSLAAMLIKYGVGKVCPV